MKSRTSFCNVSALKKDVQRFAPLWGLYSVGLALLYLVFMLESTSYYRAENLGDILPAIMLMNFGYAFLSAQVLFGDLFTPRLCNALHALPLRRETWFGTHVTAGILFSLVPNTVFAVLSAATMCLGLGWPVPLYWLLGSTLQYLCFFGIAVLSIMLTGNRFAMAVVYGLLNFGSALIWALADQLYEPLLTGIRFDQEPFFAFSPFIKLIEEYDVIGLVSQKVTDAFGGVIHRYVEDVYFSPAIWWYVIYAAAGIVMLGVSLVLYRKRKLECAGDFMAFKSTEPVLLIVYTLAVGVVFHLFSEILGDGPEKYIFLIVGLAVGYFTGTMLLERNTRVFRLRVVAGFVLFVAVMVLSLGLTALDPLGITRWVPDGEDVEKVNLSQRYEIYGYSERNMDITDPDEIAEIIAAHEYSIGRTHADELREYDGSSMFNVCIEYTLKNGRTVTRFYEVNVLSEAGRALNKYFSSFEYVMGFPEEEIPRMAEKLFRIYSEDYREERYVQGELTENFDGESLLRAIAADCAAGEMSQIYGYHYSAKDGWDRTTYLEMGFDYDVENGYQEYIYLNLYPECVNTLGWMAENGIYDAEGKTE